MDSEFIYEFISTWIQILYSIWIHDLIPLLLKIMRIQYFDLVVKYDIWICCNAFKRIKIQLSVMNSFMNWIFMNSQIIFNAKFMGEFMVSYKKHSAAAQYNQPNSIQSKGDKGWKPL